MIACDTLASCAEVCEEQEAAREGTTGARACAQCAQTFACAKNVREQDETVAHTARMLSLKGAELQHKIALRVEGGMWMEGAAGEGEGSYSSVVSVFAGVRRGGE